MVARGGVKGEEECVGIEILLEIGDWLGWGENWSVSSDKMRDKGEEECVGDGIVATNSSKVFWNSRIDWIAKYALSHIGKWGTNWFINGSLISHKEWEPILIIKAI